MNNKPQPPPPHVVAMQSAVHFISTQCQVWGVAARCLPSDLMLYVVRQLLIAITPELPIDAELEPNTRKVYDAAKRARDVLDEAFNSRIVVAGPGDIPKA